MTMIFIFLVAGVFVGVTGRSSAEAVAYFLLSVTPAWASVAVLFVAACFQQRGPVLLRFFLLCIHNESSLFSQVLFILVEIPCHVNVVWIIDWRFSPES